MKPLFSFRTLLALTLTAATAGLLLGCDKEDDFSNIPEIAVKGVTTRDSTLIGNSRIVTVLLTISWKDGDGDLGFLKDDSANAGDINYFLTIYKKKNGEFLRVDPQASTAFSGRFPNMSPEGPNSTKPFKLRGDLRYNINSPGIRVFPTATSTIGLINGVEENSRKGDVLRFSVQIKDRAGNLSNVVTTQDVTL